MFQDSEEEFDREVKTFLRVVGWLVLGVLVALGIVVLTLACSLGWMVFDYS